jgi:hypothetical protein
MIGNPIFLANAIASLESVTTPSLPGTTGQVGGDRRAACLGLVTHATNRVGCCTDEADIAVGANLRELLFLGEETVSRMDRIGAGDFGGADDACHVEVALCARRWADAKRLVCGVDVERIRVRLRINRDGLDA